MKNFTSILNQIDNWLWGPPLLILLVGTGIFLTFRLRGIQIRKLFLALKFLFSKEEGQGDVSSFAALCTALAATIGTGNIVGVATAIKAGGPGALFWMWIAAFFGMATKYGECLLSIKYRVVDKNGQMSGGPMYYIERGLGNKWLAKMFALFGIGVAFFGIGTFAQVNSITQVLQTAFHMPTILTSVILTIVVALVTLGGIKSIAKTAEVIVPFMAVFYILSSVIILLMNIQLLPGTIVLVIKSAFTSRAATGGFLGASVAMAIRNGIARGVFSNESGLGSAPIATAAAKTNSCVKQGLISMTGTFIDTIIVCTMTGLILIMTGEWAGNLEGANMTTAAFQSVLPEVGPYIVTIGLIFFAFTTILGWNYYGERCTEYLFGVKAIKPYKMIFIVLIAIGAFLRLDTIWILADIVNGLMAIPNLIALIGLSGVIVTETKSYFLEVEGKLQRNALKAIQE
ncbi:alanine/glycine:cation symporter family protein [Garciella nitratireducens]|uniref:Alanine or glycine:cation symporter, AGCS family n=1 Tax=Garciella nitratireducens DSM 15102 TaxID=1121911 RepID=A0A1T4PQ00_9FIRM|nr:sodium:alanine symporter family protein [Garciella nitratireducens]SJZ92948.1 alanine or glycine:cation symporter, AGCS family [Garciella nitratireducens DSM 15102]